jgi:hypothetical protein
VDAAHFPLLSAFLPSPCPLKPFPCSLSLRVSLFPKALQTERNSSRGELWVWQEGGLEANPEEEELH